MDKILHETLPRHYKENVDMICKGLRSVPCPCSLNENHVHNYYDLILQYMSHTHFADSFQCVNINLAINYGDIPGRPTSEYDFGMLFWSREGGKLKVLNISIAGVHFDTLLMVLVRCRNLECLTVKTDTAEVYNGKLDYSFFHEVSFPKLLDLNVCGSHDLIGPLTLSVYKNSPFLQSVTFMCGPRSCLDPASPFCVSISEILRLSLSSRLKALDVQCTSVGDDFIIDVTTSLGFQLQSLCIADSGQLTNRSLTLISEGCINLKQLMIGNWCSYVIYFTNVFSALRHLTTISLFSSDTIDNNVVANMVALRFLTSLNISHCKMVTDVGICELLGRRTRHLMTELRLVHLRITDDLINKIAPNLPNLRVLNLSYCRLITKESLNSLSCHNRLLNCLLINGCGKIDLVGRGIQLPSCVNRMTLLVHFGALGLNSFSKACLKSLELPHLKVLDCVVDQSYIHDLKSRCPSLLYVYNFCCKTLVFQKDAEILIRQKICHLECYCSPLRYCSYEWKL